MVIGTDVTEQLEPFWELDLSQEEIKYDERVEFQDCTDEVEEDWNGRKNLVRMPDGRILTPWDDVFRVGDTVGIGPNTHEVKPPLKVEEVPTKEYVKSLGMTKEEHIADWYGYVQNDEGKWGYYCNPNAKWDWWEIGGRWSGYFKVKEGVPSYRYTLGKPGVMGSCRDRGEKRADQIHKGDIDLKGMRKEAEEKANELYDVFEQTVSGLPVSESWESVRTRMETIDEAREFYHNQPMIKAMTKVDKLTWYKPEDFFVSNGGRKRFVENAFCRVITPFAILKDGKWYEKGKMGWWGVVHDEKLQYDWSAKFMELFEELPDDTLITMVDCHI